MKAIKESNFELLDASDSEEPSAGYPKATADPAQAEWWFDLGIAGGIIHEGQRFTEAQCYVKAIEADPKGRYASAAWNNLGLQGGGTVAGKAYTPKECYQKALQLYPNNKWAQENLAEC